MSQANNIMYFRTREEWRKWLSENFDKAEELWFVFPQKSSGRESMIYNDAVEEALCFEWIDSTIKPLDKDNRIQRFTPRNRKSSYSQANRERLQWVLENNMVHPRFVERIRQVVSEPFVFPEEIIARLRQDSVVWRNYQQFSEPYKRIRIAYIQAASKRTEEYEKRLNNFIARTRQNKMIAGFGGIGKYY